MLAHIPIPHAVCTRRPLVARTVVVAMYETASKHRMYEGRGSRSSATNARCPLLQIQGLLNGLNRGALEHAL